PPTLSPTRRSSDLRGRAPRAVIGTDDQTAVIAALTAAELGLPHNPPAAVQAARNKAQAREQLRAAGVPVPWFEVAARDLPRAALEDLATRAPYPCVVKALALSGSRGVIRADDPAGFQVAFTRVADLLRSPQIGARRDPEAGSLLVEP